MQKAEKKTFEESMQRLEEIVSLLETNEQSLDETVKLFEEGLTLVKDCDASLKYFENKVNELTENDGGEQA